MELVKLRLMGESSSVQATIRNLQAMANQNHEMKLVEISSEYTNRRGPGVRVYVTILQTAHTK